MDIEIKTGMIVELSKYPGRFLKLEVRKKRLLEVDSALMVYHFEWIGGRWEKGRAPSSMNWAIGLLNSKYWVPALNFKEK